MIPEGCTHLWIKEWALRDKCRVHTDSAHLHGTRPNIILQVKDFECANANASSACPHKHSLSHIIPGLDCSMRARVEALPHPEVTPPNPRLLHNNSCTNGCSFQSCPIISFYWPPTSVHVPLQLLPRSCRCAAPQAWHPHTQQPGLLQGHQECRCARSGSRLALDLMAGDGPARRVCVWGGAWVGLWVYA